ncbi:VOC family protein [Pararoseomonas indoligenes]|uniref:VOC family protein n=1 Tax=Roseomonas indoligenes TaxID=2820811 RepID=A0A940S7L3_9PROT|nr:VOC family protein [Pararoseomonas indoligenes]MBP0495179.1 VOC family protein [Pararoseomonas indoligenes]
MPAFPVSGLRSVDLTVPDLDRAVGFYTATWGLDLSAREGGSAWLRATGDDDHVLALHAGARPALRSVTFRAADEAALRRMVAAAEAEGATVLAPPAPLAEPGGGLGATLRAPGGAALRLVAGDERRAPSPAVADRPERLAHVNLNCRDVDAVRRFFEGPLGFVLSDRSKLMAFERSSADHHIIVLADAPVDGLNHVAFLLPGLEGVMRASGRLVDAGHPIAWGPGRHGPGDNVFTYFLDPFGIVVEHTAEVLQVDDDYRVRGPEEWVWPPGRTDQWGIAPAKTEAVKAAQLAIGYVP